MNGWTIERSRSSAVVFPNDSIGLAKVRSNQSREPSRPGLTMSMIAHSSPRRFSIGVPVIATLPARGQPAERTRALGRRVLDVLRLVEQQPVPGDDGERVDIPGRDVVGGHDDVVAVRGCGERRHR